MTKDELQFSLPIWNPVPRANSRGRFFELGEVRLAVLSLLQEGPSHGYQLMKDLSARVGNLYRMGSGTVYPALQQLERERLVQTRMEQGRKIYSLTRAARRVLAAEAETIKSIWSRAGAMEELGHHLGPHAMAVAGPLNELFTAALRAAAWSAGDPGREDQIRSVLRRASAELQRFAGSGREAPRP